jgi:hypothetical protein
MAADDRPMATVIAELRALDVPSLVERYEAAFGTRPRVKHREWLWRRIAWQLQAQRYGGLSTVAKRRLDELIAELDVPLERGRRATGKLARQNGEPRLGTTLTREWKGREVAATRVESGWECGGVVHGSLSAVAKAVTGSHWSGPAFFGLNANGKAPRR